MSRWITTAALLLTVGTGATDVASFTRLGGVFTSVMTANMVILGLSLALRSAVLAGHTAVAFGGYVFGVAAGARALARAPAGASGAETWPGVVTVVLGAEFVLLAVLAAGWELADARPTGAGQYLLLLIAAAAMGLQAAAVRGLGRGDFSTTYLTGTLTGLIAWLATPGRPSFPGWRQPGALVALAAGAVLSGVLVAGAPDAVPGLFLAPAGFVLASWFWRTRFWRTRFWRTRRGERARGEHAP